MCVPLPVHVVGGSGLKWVEIGTFIRSEGSDDYVFNSESRNPLNAIWPSKCTNWSSHILSHTH